MNGQVSKRAVRAAFRSTRDGLSAMAKHLQLDEGELAKEVARMIGQETASFREKHGRCFNYQIILQIVLGSGGSRAECIRHDLISRGLIKVPTMAERGSLGGRAIHRKPYGWPKGKSRAGHPPFRHRSDFGKTHKVRSKPASIRSNPDPDPLKWEPTREQLIEYRTVLKLPITRIREIVSCQDEGEWLALLAKHDLLTGPDWELFVD